MEVVVGVLAGWAAGLWWEVRRDRKTMKAAQAEAERYAVEKARRWMEEAQAGRVQLTDVEVRAARMMGYSLEEYARQVVASRRGLS